MLHINYQGSRIYGFRQENVSMFSLYVFPIYQSLCKTCDPQGRGNFWLHGDKLNKLSRSLQGDAKYQISRLKVLWFQTRMFSVYKPM